MDNFDKNNRAALQTGEAGRGRTSRISEKGRALLLFFCALCVFFSSISMCMVLIIRSADVEPLPVFQNIRPLEYVVNMQQPTDVFVPEELSAPEGSHDSELLTFLFLCVDGDESETMILTSLNLRTKQVAMLSVPRDTYINGNYKIPKIRNVYVNASDSERGIQALQEKAKEMLGFWPDYYLVLDEEALGQIFDLTGDLLFTLPEDPDYTTLDPGEQYMNGADAVEIFSCRSGFRPVETDSARVQRDFLQLMLRALFAQTEEMRTNAQLLKDAMNTNLSADEMAYLGYFLQGLDLSSIISVSLPGKVIEVEEREFYEVNPKETVELINRYFNPTDKELTVYDVNLRQLTGDSGEGEWEEYGFGNHGGTTTTKPDDEEESTDDEEEPSSSEEKPEDSSSGSEEETTESQAPTRPEESTQAPSTAPSEAPSETAAPTSPTQNSTDNP